MEGNLDADVDELIELFRKMDRAEQEQLMEMVRELPTSPAVPLAVIASTRPGMSMLRQR